MNEILSSISVFENIKHIDEFGNEYWSARELKDVLEYSQWRRFNEVIEKAKESCINSNYNVLDHFAGVGKMIQIAKGGEREVLDYKLSRYACYLIAQNGDSRKRVIALVQTYFAIQTRKQELSERNYSNLSEDEKRFYNRELTKKGNYSLNQTANDIAKRKGLRYREDILDNMGSDELIANLFRISQTDQKLKNENVIGENKANIVHYNMGKDIRKFIAGQGGKMPEELPTPEKSLKELEKKL